MKVQFHKNKYGRELLIDCAEMATDAGFIINENAFMTSFHEIYFITAGEGIFRLDDHEINFKAGTILFLPPNKWRQWLTMEQAVNGYFLIFEEEFISDYFQDTLFLYRFHFFYNNNAPFYLHLRDSEFEAVKKNIFDITKELDGLRYDSDHLLRATLYFLLINLNRFYQVQHNLSGRFFDNTLSLHFRQALEQKINVFQKVSEYADYLQVSKSHLNKTLKANFGKSTGELIKEKLLAEIKRELAFGTKSIAEIAYDLNFSDPSNFNRFFKEMTSLTPREYRLKNQNDHS